MTIKDFFSFRQNKYFWVNIIAIAATIIVLLFVVLKGISIYTHHGEAVVVPDVKGMGMSEAGKVFRNHGLNCVVSDSSYVKNLPAGCIIDYNPAAGQKVKEGRTIYLTINTLDIPQVSVPDVADNSSVRQAQARILASGFKLDEIEYIPGEKDWVYGLKYRGTLLSTGEKVSVGATLTLVVGDGDAVPQEADSLAVDSVEEAAKPATPNKKSAADESWF
ncbi:MAG: PASTA domain-containing protein [Bacteroides sp.]|jgi:beta-lactam-binding protein with PASTA domain|nr:PASTA domain-containing protein [Bacteroides sp.]